MVHWDVNTFRLTMSLASAQNSLVWCLFWTTMKVIPGSYSLSSFMHASRTDLNSCCSTCTTGQSAYVSYIFGTNRQHLEVVNTTQLLITSTITYVYVLGFEKIAHFAQNYNFRYGLK